MKEGVIKFEEEFTESTGVDPSHIIQLNIWRKVFFSLHLIGRDPSRYEGAAFGNISRRIDPRRAGGKFIITGTQTGGLEVLGAGDYTTIRECIPEKNRVVCQGPVHASSESMTHCAL